MNSSVKKLTDNKQIRIQKADANLSTFGFLFSSIIQYHSSRKRNVETELQNMGETIGVRLFELIYLRSNKVKKEAKHIDMLQFIQSTVWKTLFGKNADGLFPQDGVPNGYLIRDDSPLVLRHVSEAEGQNGAAFVVGIIKGILNEAGFQATVDSDTVNQEDDNQNEISMYPATYFSIQFDQSVIEREKLTK